MTTNNNNKFTERLAMHTIVHVMWLEESADRRVALISYSSTQTPVSLFLVTKLLYSWVTQYHRIEWSEKNHKIWLLENRLLALPSSSFFAILLHTCFGSNRITLCLCPPSYSYSHTLCDGFARACVCVLCWEKALNCRAAHKEMCYKCTYTTAQ